MKHERPKSKSGQLADLLRVRIAKGQWHETVPAERSLCQEFLVSRGTVRKALSILESHGLIAAAESTRIGRRVTRKSRGQGRLHAGRSVVVLTPTLSQSPLLLEHIAILREILGRVGVLVEVREVAHLTGIQYPKTQLARIAARSPGAAWVLHKMPHTVQTAAKALGLPCVVFGSTFEDVNLPYIDIDFRAVAAHAAGRCFAKGHSRLAVIVHRTPLAGDAAIVSEISRQLGRTGAEPPLILRHDFHRERLIASLDQRIVPAVGRPHALLIANQHHLLTALSHLQHRGLHIPRDLSLIYLSNDPVTERLSPLPDRYTVGEQLPRRLAKAAQALLDGEIPASCRLLPEMTPGESFAPRARS